ncbi:DUF1330 domain-containing protein [Microvirga antarctica]|uniref:DUF1330 domain-containing protein n=1 Tax=Microvirga antarctica TaxID=2819233 RepID=UPI001B309A93
MPKAYILAQVDAADHDAIAEYRTGAPVSVKRFGGQMLVRGGRTKSLEGREPRSRVVVIEFPSYDKALEWYHSEEYARLRSIRTALCDGDLFLVEALENPI